MAHYCGRVGGDYAKCVFSVCAYRLAPEQQAAKNVQKAMKNIVTEVRYNQNRMQYLLPRYRRMADTLSYLMEVKGGKHSFLTH